jgi:hypothetical protein
MPRSKKPVEEVSRLGEEWDILEESGEAPQLAGRSVEEAERDKERTRKLMPSEIRRRGRKITPTLSAELADEVRDLCAELGYTNDEGEGVVASPVIEKMLRFVVDGYREGKIELTEEQYIETSFAFRWPED